MNTINKSQSSLTFKIIAAMVIGFLVGILLNQISPAPWVSDYLIHGLFEMGGRIFLASLKLLVVPLVFVSLVCGTASLGDIKKLGSVGIKTLGLYTFTTALAIALAMLAAIIIRPGSGVQFQTNSVYEAKAAPSLVDTIVNIFPSNPIQAMAEGNMLQIIVFSLLLGMTLTLVGQAGSRILQGFNDFNEVILKMVMLLMHIAPYGVFCLIAKVFTVQGFDAILPLAKYFFVVLFVLFLHAFVSYPVLLKVMSGLDPFVFYRKFKEVLVFAFSTSSSNATLPVTLETVEHRLGVHNSIASFTIPLGATINMDGTAIMQGVATVFISQVYGIDIGLSGYLMVILSATLASIGTAGVPGVGLITLAMVLRQVNLPVEGIALIIGVDRLLDMVRTAVNVTGDAVASCIVAKSEKQLDLKVYHS